MKGKNLIFKRISILSIIIMVCLIGNISVYAENWFCPVLTDQDGWRSDFYEGEYDVSAEHEVSVYIYKDEEKCKENLQACYQEFLSWGMTPEGAIAVIGNIMGESGGDPSAIEAGAEWEDLWFYSTIFDSYGFYSSKGMGLIQFTWYTLKFDVLNIAAQEGKQWTDLGVQLKVLKGLVGPEYKDTDDIGQLYKSNINNTFNGIVFTSKIAKLTYLFCAVVEKPAFVNSDERTAHAEKAFNEWGFKDLKPKSYDGTVSPISNGSSSGIEEFSITNQWDLEGMPTKSGLVSDIIVPNLPDGSDLSVSEKYNMAQIGQTISSSHEFDIWTSVRVCLVFFGLLLVVYSIILALALLFDTFNNFINISLISIMTFGKIKCSNDIVCLEESNSYTSSKRVIALIIILFVVGCLFISGGVLPTILKAIYSIITTVSSWF